MLTMNPPLTVHRGHDRVRPWTLLDAEQAEIAACPMKADAERIVRAVNAHDELTDALYRALPYLEDAERDPAYKPGAVAKLTAELRTLLARLDAQAAPQPAQDRAAPSRNTRALLDGAD